ncbi:MAG: pilus assembly protein PilM [Candidatus Omnitrophica bacterium]|nr:pilus assembly protein PilM [Candidatus Omnitrophota bacterium]
MGAALNRLAQWLPAPVGRSFTALSIDGQWVKLLHATGAPRGRTIASLIVLPVPEGDAGLVDALRQRCRAQGIEPESVLIANPSHLTTTRVFSVPSSEWREIRDIVELQAEKHTPYSKEEILTDFSIVETDAAGYSKVMLVISHQEVVNRAIRIAEAMGWSLERVGLELEGLAGWLRAVRGATPKQPVLVADVDAEVTTAAVIRQQKILFHRSLPFGVKQLIAEPSGVPSRLIAELRRTLEAFEAEGWQQPVSDIVLTGQVERLPDLKAQLQQGLEIPTEAVAAAERFALGPGVVAAQAELGQSSFASLLGLSVGAETGIDLTPKPLRLHRVFELRTRALITLGCQLIAAVVLVAGLAVFEAQQRERYRGWLRAESERAGLETSALDFSLKQVELVRGWLTARGRFLELLVELNRRSSDAIRWDTLEFVQSDRLLLKGTSSEMPKVYEMVSALEKSGLFAKVDAKKVTKRRDGEENVTSFELTCELLTEPPPSPQVSS